MEFTVSQNDINKAMAFVSSAVSPRGTLPILANVLISAKSNRITLTCTNLELEKRMHVVAEVVEEGDITVDAKKAFDFVKNADKNKDIKFKLNGNDAFIQSGRSKWKLATLPSIDFPAFISLDSYQTVSVSSEHIHTAIAKCAPSMANKEVRYYLNGMMFDVTESGMNVVATDGHRLNMSSIECASDSSLSFIVPRDSIPSLEQILEESGETVIKVSKSHIQTKTLDMQVTTKLIDGKYPSYQRVVPSGTETYVSINTAEITQALKRVMPLSNEKFRGIQMNFEQGRLMIDAKNPLQEEATEDVEVGIKGNDMLIGFNGNYVQSALSCLDGDNFTLELVNASTAAKIQEGNFTAVLMPMRL